MKKNYAIIAGVVLTVGLMFANTFASFLWFNQPEAPKCLVK